MTVTLHAVEPAGPYEVVKL